MYVYIYIYIYVCVCIYIYIYIHMYIRMGGELQSATFMSLMASVQPWGGAERDRDD